jgi:hypothetical protein
VINRRLNAKKKVENNISTFIKNIQMGISPPSGAADGDKDA